MIPDLGGIPARLRPFLPEWAEVTSDRLSHIRRVAELVDEWAMTMMIPENERQRWLRAVWLHDALRDASDERLLDLTPSLSGPVKLRHGPASAALAKAYGETDRGVLDAVRFHSVGLAEWDLVGWVLYCADYLEPGRTYLPEECAELRVSFPNSPRRVTQIVAQRRLAHLVTQTWSIPEPTYRFWNSLSDFARR